MTDQDRDEIRAIAREEIRRELTAATAVLQESPNLLNSDEFKNYVLQVAEELKLPVIVRRRRRR